MPRQPRVENIGFHHIINRGVARGDIFLRNDDFEKFLEILKDAKLRYDFIIHSFCLMNNHYHLLIETKSENLSLIARQINSKYAQYFNREYKRVGPLWQGRFKNWFVYDNSYLLILFKYIEQNPVKANITMNIGEYRYSSSFCVAIFTCKEILEGSLLYDKALFENLNSEINNEELRKLTELEKAKYKKDKKIVRLKQNPLDFYFDNKQTIKERNAKIQEAVIDGYKQSEIADFLKLSRTVISKAFKDNIQGKYSVY